MGDITLSAKVIVESPLVRGVDVSAENNAAMDFARRMFDGVKIVRSLFDEKFVDTCLYITNSPTISAVATTKSTSDATGWKKYAASAIRYSDTLMYIQPMNAAGYTGNGSSLMSSA